MIRSLIALLFLTSVCTAQVASPTVSEDTLSGGLPPSHSHISVGIMPLWTFSRHTSDFYSYEGVLCGVFTSGNGNGPGVGFSLEDGLGKFATAGLRIAYLNESGTFNTSLPTYQARDTSTGQLITVERNNAFIATVHDLSLGADVKLYPLTYLNTPESDPPAFDRIYAILGATVDIPITKTFDERESITNTNKVVFIDGTSDHSLVSGTIPNMAMRIGVLGGVGYDIPLSREWSVSPEISYNLGVTKTNSGGPLDVGYQWKTSYINAGATLRYTIIPPPPPPEPPAPAPQAVPKEAPETLKKPVVAAPKPQSPLLKVAVAAQTVNGQPPPPILVEEVHVRESFPMLGYIFFDSLSSTIPSRYNLLDSNGARSFNERDLPSTTLGVYHSILNIVGKRMLENPDTRLTITGCRDEYSEGAAVAKARAEAVRDYFVNTWGIEPKRLHIVVHGHPAAESNPDYPEGRAENRRVELTTDDNTDIFAPVVVVESARQTSLENDGKSDSNDINFVPSVVSAVGVKRWQLAITDSVSNIRTYESNGDVPPVIRWNLKTAAGDPPGVQGHLQYTLSATDATGQTAVTAPQELVVNQRLLTRERGQEVTKQHTLEKYSLIVFQYNSRDISRANRKAAEQIATHILPNSIVTVSGFTDKLGTDDYDKALAEGRAENVAHILQSESGIPDSNITVNGVGKTDIFPNDLPEGRFFCRTVQVVIDSHTSATTPAEGTKNN